MAETKKQPKPNHGERYHEFEQSFLRKAALPPFAYMPFGGGPAGP